MDASVALYDQGVADEKARCDAEVTMLREQLALAFEAGRVAEREECISIVESYKVSVGNSRSGELACEWTMENLREIRDAIRARSTKAP
jgi:hypothetical protein